MRVARLALLSVVPFAGGCAMGNAPVIPPAALIQTYKAPLDIDYQDTQLGAKQGTSTAQTVLGTVSWGDASTRAAADGGIQKVHYADYEVLGVLGVYFQLTVRVSGD